MICTLTGTVIRGKGLGHTVGMPTANLLVNDEKCLPAEGVYASVIRLKSGTYFGLTNIGRRPSVDDDKKITVETFIFDFDDDIYGQEMTLDVCFFVREIRKFPNLQSVMAQVEKDIAECRQKLEAMQI